MIPVDDLKTMADTRSDLLELFPGVVDEAYSKKLWEKLVLACACTNHSRDIFLGIFLCTIVLHPSAILRTFLSQMALC